MRNPIKRVVNLVRHISSKRREPLRVEFVLTDFCNLNCKGCGHYSPLAPREFLDPETLRRTAGHLSRTCGQAIGKIYIMGGETLLYPNLPEAIETLRNAFPKQGLYLFTNGILLPKMDNEFWKACVENNVIVSITRYPVRFDYDKVLELCRAKGVKCEVFGDRSLKDNFFKFGLDPEKRQNGWVSHLKCYNRGCLTLIGERLYPCSVSGCVSHLNRACGTDFRHEPGDWIDVADIKDARSLKRLRDHKVPFCDYCISPPRSTTYGPSKRVASEWVEEPESGR